MRMTMPVEFELLRRCRAATEQRPTNRGREHVVQIKMQLAQETDAGAAGMVHRDDGLRSDLEVSAHPDHPWIDRADGDRAVAEIVGDWCCELGLDDRNEVIDEIGKLVIADLRFQVRHAVLNRSAIDQRLRNERAGIDVERAGRELITDLPGDREGAQPPERVGQVAKALAEIECRRECRPGIRQS
jgi:hypothetical protein